MAWTAASFKARRPTFNPVADAVVTSALEEAARRVDPRVFGDRTDDAVSLLAAHLLSVDPGGQAARLKSTNASTTYLEDYRRLMRERAGGPWTSGQGTGGMLP
jgi:hypothetical protein